MALSVYLSAIVLTFFLSHVHSQGLTLDKCRRNTDCRGSRMCINLLLEDKCRSLVSTDSCRCIPEQPVSCLSDDVCPKGEVCAAARGLSRNTRFICVSKSIVDDADNGFFRATQSNPDEGALTRDRCKWNSDCLAPRICILESSLGGPGACVGSSFCSCLPPTFVACESDNDCSQGEICGYMGQDTCVSPRAFGSGQRSDFANPTAAADPEAVQEVLDSEPNGNEPSGNEPNGNEPNGNEPNGNEPITVTREVCVAERHLKGMKGIYETGRHARVLCDTQGSCATPGHMVVFRGESMMMRRYCEVVGCVDEVMKVNSPLWERGLRVESWSDGLEFTAFAARYETSAEEVVLRGLVRAGL